MAPRRDAIAPYKADMPLCATLEKAVVAESPLPASGGRKPPQSKAEALHRAPYSLETDSQIGRQRYWVQGSASWMQRHVAQMESRNSIYFTPVAKLGSGWVPVRMAWMKSCSTVH